MTGGKKSTSTSTIAYDPQALNQYHSNLSTAFPVLQDFAQNPYGNPFFQMNMGMLNKQAAQSGQSGMENIFNNAKQINLSPGTLSPFLASQVAKQGRATSGLQQQGRVAAMGQAQQNQMFSLGQLAGFQPLMTGQTSTEKQSGGALAAFLAAGLGAAGSMFNMPGSNLIPKAAGGGLPLSSVGGFSGMNLSPSSPFSGGMSAYNASSSFLPGESLGIPNGGPPGFNPFFFGPYGG